MALTRIGIVGFAAALIVGVTLWVAWPTPTPPVGVPQPPDRSNLDPDVVRLIDRSIIDVQQSPLAADRWLTLAMVYHANQQPTPAESCYERAIELNPELPRARYFLGLLLHDRNELSAAQAQWRSVTELAPDFAPVHWRLGFAALDDGDTGAAIEAFRAALERAPDEIPALIGLARAHLLDDEPEIAIDHLERARATSRTNVAYIDLLLGQAYQRIGRADDAAAALERGRNAQANLTDPWEQELLTQRHGFEAQHTRAQRLIEAGRFNEAVAILESLRDREPDHAIVRSNLAAAYRHLNRLEQSLNEARASIRLNDRYAPAHLNQAATLIRLMTASPRDAQPDLAHRARASLEAAMRINPDLPDLSMLFGDLELQTGRLEAALQWYRKEAAGLPSRAEPRFRAGVVLLYMDRSEEARAELRAALDRDPRHFDALLALANASLASGDLDAARRHLLEAQQRRENDPRVQQLARSIVQQTPSP